MSTNDGTGKQTCSRQKNSNVACMSRCLWLTLPATENPYGKRVGKNQRLSVYADTIVQEGLNHRWRQNITLSVHAACKTTSIAFCQCHEMEPSLTTPALCWATLLVTVPSVMVTTAPSEAKRKPPLPVDRHLVKFPPVMLTLAPPMPSEMSAPIVKRADAARRAKAKVAHGKCDTAGKRGCRK